MDCLPGDQQVYVVLFVALLFFFSFVQNSAFFWSVPAQSSCFFLGVLVSQICKSIFWSVALMLSSWTVQSCCFERFFWRFLFEENDLATCRRRVQVQTLTGVCCGCYRCGGGVGVGVLTLFLCWAVVGKCSRFNLIELERVFLLACACHIFQTNSGVLFSLVHGWM